MSGSVSFDEIILGNINGNAATATTASYAVTASYAENATAWDGRFAGNAKITGSLTISGSQSPFNAKFANPSVGQETEIFSYEGVIDQKGDPYGIARTLYQNYNFGTGYDHTFSTEFYDSFSYNYGTEFAVGPRAINGAVSLNNGDTGFLRVREYGTTGQTEAFLAARSASLSANGFAEVISSGDRYNALRLQYTNPQGSAAASSSLAGVNIGQVSGDATQTSLEINANDILVGYNNVQSGGGAASITLGNTDFTKQVRVFSSQSLELQGGAVNINSAVTTISGSLFYKGGAVYSDYTNLAIASTTASIDITKGSYYQLTLVSGSNTHILLTGRLSDTAGTLILKTAQPGTGYGTITFDSEFKFPDGLAPTATEASSAQDIYTFVYYSEGNIYTTQVANLS